MLKSVSSITNAIGALNFKGTWDANANSPALASSVGIKGDYYVVGTAGSTNLNGISNWGVGDWATFNGSVWQRVEGGADLNGVNLSVSGTSTLSNLTASTALALDASKQVVSVTNTGTGNNVLATSPVLATPDIGVATATSVNKVALTAPATAATLTIANNKTLAATHSLTLAGTDSTTMTFPATSASVARIDAAQTFSGIQTFSGSITGPSSVTLNDSSLKFQGGDIFAYVTSGLKSVFYGQGVYQEGGYLFAPTANNNCSLGDSSHKWTAVWATNGTIQTSDERAKTDIQETPLGLSFIMSLKPRRYKMLESGNLTEGEIEEYTDENGNVLKRIKDGSRKQIPGKRYHEGLIAQEVKESLDLYGVDSAIWINAEDNSQGLRYEELISPLIKALQEQQTQIETLKADVAALKGI